LYPATPRMDKVPTRMMTDEQLKALREWGVKSAAAEVAKAKHHKALDAELRQLRVDGRGLSLATIVHASSQLFYIFTTTEATR
jgi:hypothetical protein